MKDLVALVADKNTHFVLHGLLPRYRVLGIRSLTYDIYSHPQRDPGVYQQAVNFLRPLQNLYRYALVFLDREGSGQEHKTAAQISEELKTNLERNGWLARAEAVVFDPELEIWAWVNSPHLAKHLGWGDLASLETFVREQGFWESDSPKPHRPKEAIELALREKRIQRSSAIYKSIAEAVSFQGCREPSFLKFREVLQQWFPAVES